MPTPHSSLVIVGTGIKFISHLTTEARAHIQQADKVLYLVNDPAMKAWIHKNNPQSTSLDDLYFQFPQRQSAYQAITEHILMVLRTELHLCVILYGHPAIYAQPALLAAQIAKQEGFNTQILPGISAEDCLFADLQIDPGSSGCQSYEATDFLIYQRPFSIYSHLILWQVGMIGALGLPQHHDNANGIRLLRDRLQTQYSASHHVYLYEGAQYATFEPKILKCELSQIHDAPFTSISTLYVPPAAKAAPDRRMLAALGLVS